jgi:C4-dicarboxylate-specific signal transduction histidine kinase
MPDLSDLKALGTVGGIIAVILAFIFSELSRRAAATEAEEEKIKREALEVAVRRSHEELANQNKDMDHHKRRMSELQHERDELRTRLARAGHTKRG